MHAHQAMLRQTLESATSEFAVNMLASIPDVYPEEQVREANSNCVCVFVYV